MQPRNDRRLPDHRRARTIRCWVNASRGRTLPRDYRMVSKTGAAWRVIVVAGH